MNATDRQRCLLGAVALGILGLGACAHDEPKSFVRDDLEEITATIESVNRDTREVVIRHEDGTRNLFTLGPEVRNFDQIEEGDRVVLSYYEGLAAEVKPKGEAVAEDEDAVTSMRAPEGSRPAGAVGASVVATVQIQSVDTSLNLVTFKRADGIVRTIKVEKPDGVAFIKTLKPGDNVQVTYTEAVAISVEPATVKPASTGEPARR